jgi:NitT/TauT family transport system substrate-binding protein
MNDALLSDSIDIASGGMPGLLTIWAKTRGSAQEVRGVSAMSQQPLILNSRNPNVHSIKDFTDADRIAMPAVKVSAQAVLLEMAAAREWGDAAFDRLDRLTFSISPPDATAGLLSGNADFNAAFTVPPYQNMQLRDPAVHTVISSFDLVGPSSGGMAWTSKRFHDNNPKLYRALLDAMQEASDFIAAHPRQTVAYYAADSKAKIDTDLMDQLMADPKFKYILTPHASMQWAEFMYNHVPFPCRGSPAKVKAWMERGGLRGIAPPPEGQGVSAEMVENSRAQAEIEARHDDPAEGEEEMPS